MVVPFHLQHESVKLGDQKTRRGAWVHFLRHFPASQGRTRAGIEISITESLSERSECRFPSAVAGCDVRPKAW